MATREAEEEVILRIFFKHEGLSLMHKVFEQIFINNVLISVLRINECNTTICKIVRQLKRTAKDKLEDMVIQIPKQYGEKDGPSKPTTRKVKGYRKLNEHLNQSQVLRELMIQYCPLDKKIHKAKRKLAKKFGIK